MRRVVGIAVTALLLVSPLLVAQQQGEASDISRYPTDLRVAVKNPQVRLTWNDAGGLTDERYRIYRAEQEITEETVSQATEIGTVTEGTETFLDVPQEDGSYYYAVLAVDSDGSEYRNFARLRNTTTEAVEITVAQQAETPPVEVRGIAAEVEGDTVALRFRTNRTGRDLAIYRSTEKLTDSAALSEATQIATINSRESRFTDYPVPGVPYYYAVLDTQQVEEGTVTFRPERNTTSQAVQVPLGERAVLLGPEEESEERDTVRPTPLPLLQLSRQLESGRALPTPQTRVPDETVPLGQATQEAVKRLQARAAVSKPAVSTPEPAVLPADRGAEKKGTAYTLQTVLTGPFENGDWEETLTLLDNLLSKPLSASLEARVHFYRGQAYFFREAYRDAFFAFLLAKSELPEEITPWIDAILRERTS
jgi:uncharacterized protein YdbL (DUF1318 family)